MITFFGDSKMTEKTVKTVDSGVKVSLPVVAKPVVEITKAQLVNLLFGVKGVTFIGADTKTDPDMNKGGRENANYLLGKVDKFSFVSCMLGFDYEARRDTLASKKWLEETIEAAKEAGIPDDVIQKSIGTLKEYSEQSIEKFEAKPRQWGKHMINPNTGKVSRVMVNHTKKDRKTGELLPETYAEYMQVEILNAKSPEYRYKDSGEILTEEDMETLKKYLKPRQEDDLVIRDYAINNILNVRINKAHYKVNG